MGDLDVAPLIVDEHCLDDEETTLSRCQKNVVEKNWRWEKNHDWKKKGTGLVEDPCSSIMFLCSSEYYEVETNQRQPIKDFFGGDFWAVLGEGNGEVAGEGFGQFGRFQRKLRDWRGSGWVTTTVKELPQFCLQHTALAVTLSELVNLQLSFHLQTLRSELSWNLTFILKRSHKGHKQPNLQSFCDTHG